MTTPIQTDAIERTMRKDKAKHPHHSTFTGVNLVDGGAWMADIVIDGRFTESDVCETFAGAINSLNTKLLEREREKKENVDG